MSGEASFVAEETGEWDFYISTNKAQKPSTTDLKIRVSKESGIEWEQGFINTPSFDYPSEVKCVGDNINLFSTDFYDDFSNNSGATHETIDDMIKVSTSSVNQFSGIYLNTIRPNVVELNNKIKGKTVTYSFEAKADTNINLSFGKSDVSKIRQVTNKWRKLFITYENASSCRIYFYNDSAIVTTFYIRNIKLEYGGYNSSYSDFNMGSIGLKISNKNFLNIEKDSSVESNGLKVTTDSNGILNLNGTTNNNIYLSLDLKHIGTSGGSVEQKHFKKGNYKFSCENLSSIQDLNVSAYIADKAVGTRKTFALLYKVFNQKTKTATASILEDTEAVVYLWIASGITLNNAKLKFQIELDNATEIVAHEEQNYVIPVQQRMFKQDKFIKINGVWKEMHTMGTVYSKDVSNIVVSGSAVSGVDGFYRYNVNLGISNRKGGSYIRLYSNYFKYGDSRWNNKEGICGWENGQSFSLGTYNKNYDTADKLKEFLTENNVEFDYELAKPIYLDCTPEQVAVLDKIEQEAHTYSEVTNVYTEDEVGAIIKTNTNINLRTMFNNMQAQILAE